MFALQVTNQNSRADGLYLSGLAPYCLSLSRKRPKKFDTEEEAFRCLSRRLDPCLQPIFAIVELGN